MDKTRQVRRIVESSRFGPEDECPRCRQTFSEKAGQGCREPEKWLHTCNKAHTWLKGDRCDLTAGVCFVQDRVEREERLLLRGPRVRITAGDIEREIGKQYRAADGWKHVSEIVLISRRIDLLSIRRTGEIIGWEIKVERSDWVSEMNDPGKHIEALEVCNSFRFVAPVGVIEPEEVPTGTGLTAVTTDPSGRLHLFQRVIAPHRYIAGIPTDLLGRIVHRMD